MTQVDTIRHMELFNNEAFHTPIHVIGAGASGSWLVLQLAKLGITRIHVWDFDVVESQNVANQLFGIGDIGKPKVDALHDLVASLTGTKIITHNEEYTNQQLNGYVFCMIDTMSGRKHIWENAVKLKPQVELYVEPRMGMDMARIYNMKPLEYETHAGYEATLYGDEEGEVSACGASVSVITSAIVVAGWCVRQLINNENSLELPNEILVDFMYNNIITNTWKPVIA